MRTRDEDSTDDLARFGSDEPAEMICPSCRGIVSEETAKCPHCGDWITPVDPSSTGLARWIYLLAVIIMLLIVLRWVI
ncbi:MAG TPA: hypothetical protein VMV81_13740 [Phycisphaerae bacterium]|nr:hypothetical protein [Phycisphaerae bacterium]